MEIENIMDPSEFDDILWNGDLDYDKSRNTGFVTTVSRFLDRLGLLGPSGTVCSGLYPYSHRFHFYFYAGSFCGK